MKKLFLSLIILLLAINPIFGMKEDGEQQRACARCSEVSLGEAALNVIADHLHAGNTHLVRSIAREWLEQHPNGTYREFLDEYTQHRSLPVRLMRAVWLEVMRAQQITRQIKLLQQIAGYAGEIARITIHHNRPDHIWGYMTQTQERAGSFIYLNFDCQEIGSSHYHRGIISRSEGMVLPAEYSDAEVEQIFSSFDQTRDQIEGCLLDRVGQTLQYLFGQSVPPLFCTIRIALREQPLSMSSVIIQRLHTIVQRACRGGFCVLIRLVPHRDNDNISHIVVVHVGVIAVIPNIIFPAGATGVECRRITQEAVACAIDHQLVFRTIQEAIRYLKDLDSESCRCLN